MGRRAKPFLKLLREIDKEIERKNKSQTNNSAKDENIGCFPIILVVCSIVFLIFIFSLMSEVLIENGTKADTAKEIAGIIIAIFVSIFSYAVYTSAKKKEREEKEQEERRLTEEKEYFATLIKEHSKVLLHKRKIYLVPNEYGAVNREKWIAETDKFFKSVYGDMYEITQFDKESFSYFVETALKGLEPQTSSGMKFEDVESGVDYEDYIQDIIEQEGFIVETTATTGDQGVDLIAYSDKNHDFKIAIQCKFYSKPVGNKAVQEVKAGMDFYECQLGCVCTNNEYTPSAKSLANKLDIALLNEDTILDYLKEKLDY